jgi:hypothetical protein
MQAVTTTGNHHGQMTKVHFKKWVQKKWIPSLPPNSVLVVVNSSYYCMQMDRVTLILSKNLYNMDM